MLAAVNTIECIKLVIVTSTRLTIFIPQRVFFSHLFLDIPHSRIKHTYTQSHLQIQRMCMVWVVNIFHTCSCVINNQFDIWFLQKKRRKQKRKNRVTHRNIWKASSSAFIKLEMVVWKIIDLKNKAHNTGILKKSKRGQLKWLNWKKSFL